MKPIKKAYRVWNPDDYDYDHPDNGDTVYAENRNQARAKQATESEVYLKTKARRDKENDIVIFEGKEEKRGWAEYKVKSRREKEARTKAIESQPEGETFYAQRHRDCVGNAVLLWRKNNCGYCCSIHEAQEYTKEEAIKQFADAGSDVTLWPKSHIMNCLKTVVEVQELERTKAL
jgi:hypothetical protein